MKNVTISLDEKVALWVRHYAAERKTSVSRVVGELLRERMQREENYGASMQHYLSLPAYKLKKSGSKYPKREKLHER